MDGHSGIENREVKKDSTSNFQFILAFLKTASGEAYFIIHATSNVVYGPTPHPLKFLELIGFELFDGECSFFYNRCLWRRLATFEEYEPGFENINATQAVHTAFKDFVDNVERLYGLFQEQNRILSIIAANNPTLKIFATPPIIRIEATEIPIWVEHIKFEKLISLEQQQVEIEKEIKDLQEYLPLVYADGDILVSAVLKSLKLFELKADLTEKGFTVDILAKTEDGSKKFGFEVTGCTEGIKKDSKKLTQVLDFERIKEHNEKTILVANTFKNVPIEERKGKEHFTKNVVDFLVKHPILLMTGYDLYQMVKDILENKKSTDEIIRILYETTGVLKYP